MESVSVHTMQQALDAMARCEGDDARKLQAALDIVLPAVLQQCSHDLDAQARAVDSDRHPYHRKGLQAAANSLRARAEEIRAAGSPVPGAAGMPNPTRCGRAAVRTSA